MAKKSENPIGLLDGPIIEQVVLVDYLTWNEPGSFKSNSLPGHLIHLVTEGESHQVSAGIKEKAASGCMVWYHENETTIGNIVKAPWSFYTVNFIAPTLRPPSEDKRVVSSPPEAHPLMKRLLAAWRDQEMSPVRRHIILHSLILDLVLKILPDDDDYRSDKQSGSWWRIEDKLRQDLSQPIDLEYIQKTCGVGRQALIKACCLATGQSPMKRIKEIRMSYARGLVLYSDSNFTEIAFRVGYTRSQEFSRDYHLCFGLTPSKDRAHGPRYREREWV